MIKKVGVILMMAICICSITFGAELKDINNHWAKAHIKRLVNNSNINGYPDETFKPENAIKINEFIKLFVSSINVKLEWEDGSWDAPYIKTAKAKGLIDEDMFKDYNQYISRNEVVAIISKYIDLENVKLSNKEIKDLSENRESVLKLIELGIINGYQDNTFRGENTITRAEAVSVICRTIDVRKNQVFSKKYNFENVDVLTNIKESPNYNSEFTNRYDIKNNELVFFDSR